jgi:hypothetical protein
MTDATIPVLQLCIGFSDIRNPVFPVWIANMIHNVAVANRFTEPFRPENSLYLVHLSTNHHML